MMSQQQKEQPVLAWSRVRENPFINRGAAGIKTVYQTLDDRGGLLLVGRDGWEGGFAWQVQRDGVVVSQGKTRTLRVGKLFAEKVAGLSSEEVERFNKEMLARQFFGW
jgi:hypothetical protein